MSDRVLVSVPAKAEYAKTVRLVAASLAARAGMTYEQVEDLRIAADEAFVLVCDRAVEDGHVEVEFELSDEALVLGVATRQGDAAASEDAVQRAEYARVILQAVCDELDMPPCAGECRVRVVKRVTAGAPGA